MIAINLSREEAERLVNLNEEAERCKADPWNRSFTAGQLNAEVLQILAKALVDEANKILSKKGKK